MGGGFGSSRVTSSSHGIPPPSPWCCCSSRGSAIQGGLGERFLVASRTGPETGGPRDCGYSRRWASRRSCSCSRGPILTGSVLCAGKSGACRRAGFAGGCATGAGCATGGAACTTDAVAARSSGEFVRSGCADVLSSPARKGGESDEERRPSCVRTRRSSMLAERCRLFAPRRREEGWRAGCSCIMGGTGTGAGAGAGMSAGVIALGNEPCPSCERALSRLISLGPAAFECCGTGGGRTGGAAAAPACATVPCGAAGWAMVFFRVPRGGSAFLSGTGTSLGVGRPTDAGIGCSCDGITPVCC